MGKHKQQNTVEKCDEWLSTRTKSKIQTPKQSVKRASLSKPLRNIGNIILTQSSPPPKELQTHTKQSVLSEYFSKQPTDVSNTDDVQLESSDELPVFLKSQLNEQDKENHTNIGLSGDSSHEDQTNSIENNSMETYHVDCFVDCHGDSQYSSDDLPHLFHRKPSRPANTAKSALPSLSGDSNSIADNYKDIYLELPLLTRNNNNIKKKFTNKYKSTNKKPKNKSKHDKDLQHNRYNGTSNSHFKSPENTERENDHHALNLTIDHVNDNKSCFTSDQSRNFNHDLRQTKRQINKNNISSINDNSKETNHYNNNDPFIDDTQVSCKHKRPDDTVNSGLDFIIDMSESDKNERPKKVSCLSDEFDLMTEFSEQVIKDRPDKELSSVDSDLDLLTEVTEPARINKELQTLSSLNSNLYLMSKATEPIKSETGLQTSQYSDLDLLSEVTEPARSHRRLQTVSSVNSDHELMSGSSEVRGNDNLISSQEADLELENFSLENDSQIGLQ